MPRKPFLLRIDEEVLASLQKWADDELRSLNGHIEYLLRQALSQRGRGGPSKRTEPPAEPNPPPNPDSA